MPPSVKRLRVAGVVGRFGSRHEVDAWKAGSTKRRIRFPDAAVQARFPKEVGSSLVTLLDFVCKLSLNFTLLEFGVGGCSLPDDL